MGQELDQAFPSSFIEAPLQSISQNAASFTRVSPRDCWQDGSHSHLEYNQKNSILSFCHILFTGSRSLENTLIGHETLIKKNVLSKSCAYGLIDLYASVSCRLRSQYLQIYRRVSGLWRHVRLPHHPHRQELCVSFFSVHKFDL